MYYLACKVHQLFDFAISNLIFSARRYGDRDSVCHTGLPQLSSLKYIAIQFVSYEDSLYQI